MFSNIKLVFLALAFVLIGRTQLQAQENQQKIKAHSYKEHVIFSFSYLRPIPFGNNVGNKSYRIKNGWQHSFWVRVSPKIWVGTKLTCFDADVQNYTKAGIYDDVNTFSFGPMAGYEFTLNKKINMLVGTGIGYVRYTNYKTNAYEFIDEGTSFWLSSNLEYELIQNIGAYFSATYRRDFLKTTLYIDPNYFDSNYLVLSFGIRFSF